LAYLPVPREIISPGFTEATATKLGVSPRTVRQEVQIFKAAEGDIRSEASGGESN